MSPLRDQRLTTKADFSKTLSSRRGLSGRYVKLRFARTGGNSQARLGMAVGKRMTGTSVLRNAVRRQLSERFRAKAGDLRGFDVVAVLTRPCRDRTQARMAGAEFGALLEKMAAGDSGK